MFEAEIRRVGDTLADVVIAAHHIGSTAVPGLDAKPIIDMLLVVSSHGELDARDAAMVEIGYQPRGEFRIPGRRYFTRGSDDARTHHIHAFPTGHHRIKDHLLFRDYLVASPHRASDYGELKRHLAAQHPHDIEAYCAGKENLIRELIGEAWAWDAGGRR